MHRHLLTLLLIALLVGLSGAAQNPHSQPGQQSPPHGPGGPVGPGTSREAWVPIAPDPADVESIDSIVAAYYAAVSGPAGQERDWDRYRSLFHPGSRIIGTRVGPQTGVVETLTIDIEQYIKLQSGYMTAVGYTESEIARTVDSYGHIAQVFSTYETSRQMSTGPLATRGINSIQLLNDGKRWWILTILWDKEDPETPIPAQYLPRAAGSQP